MICLGCLGYSSSYGQSHKGYTIGNLREKWHELGKSAYAGLVGLALILARVFDYHWTMNVGRRPFCILDQDCHVITNRIVEEVEKAGMQTLRSFDLDTVRSTRQGFCCPIHGTNACSCHMVILLILLREHGSLTLILEGSDQQTSIYLDTGLGVIEEQVDPSLTIALTRAIYPKTVH